MATMEGGSRAPKRRIKDQANPTDKHSHVDSSTNVGDDETRMYAKLILTKVKKLEVEVAALSQKGSVSGPVKVEVIDLEAEEGEENTGGGNPCRGQKRGDYDDLNRLKQAIEDDCKKIQGEVLTLRKVAELLVDHVTGSEGSTSNPTNMAPPKLSCPPGLSSNVFAAVSDDDSKSDLGILTGNTNLTPNAGLIKRSKGKKKTKVTVGSGRSEPGASSSNFDVEEEQHELTEVMQMTVADEDRTCAAASKKGMSNKDHSGVSGEQQAVKKTRHDKALRRTADVPKVLQGNDSTTQIVAGGGDSMNPETGSLSMSATSPSSIFPEAEAVKNAKARTCANTSSQLPTKSAFNSGQRARGRNGNPGCKLECIFCQRKFKAKRTLEEHILRHIGERPHFCHLCPYESTTNGVLQLHLETHKSVREKRFKCKVCNKDFVSNGVLSMHIGIVHEKKRPFKCEECPKTFPSEFTLKRHMVVHTGEKNHCCEICNRKFSQKVHLDRHIWSHAEERPHKCRFCGKAYKHLMSQQIHEKIHRK